MKPELWGDVERLYYAALEQPADQRAAFVSAACADNDELRHEVAGLLDYDEQAAQFIETAAIAVVARKLADDQRFTTPSRSLVGSKVGAYEVLSQLGRGGMSEVYLALDPRLGRKVALKFLPTVFSEETVSIRRLEQEARSLSALNHPNIVTIHEIGRDSGEHYIVEEFVDGPTLRQKMAEAPSRKMPVARTIEIAAQIADALAVAHETGVTHRDVKPENVMVRPDGIVKILDFGLAKLTEEQRWDGKAEGRKENDPAIGLSPRGPVIPSQSDSDFVMGTPRYMSPEQARGQKVDARTDVFSLGVVMYEMIAGKPPFDGVNPQEMIGSIVNQKPQSLATVAPEAPGEMKELERIIFKCLSKDRDARYPSARSLANELHHLKEFVTSQSIAPAQSLSKSAVTPRWLMVTITALIVLTAALGYAIFSRSKPGEKDQIKTLAVLPFKPITREKEENYLGLGIADTIITKVSQVKGLVVRPTSSVRRYVSQEADALQVAREQHVDAVLDGTLQHDGDRLRVSVNLLQTSDGASLWSDQFDLSSTEIFGLQDKVAHQVVERLHYRISAAEQKSIAKQSTVNLAAYDSYTKAMFYLADRGVFPAQRGPSDRAIELFRKAVELDPNYALAHTQLGYAYAHNAIWFEDNPALLESAKRELQIAEELDPQLAEIYVARSTIFWSQHEGYKFEEAIRGLRHAQQIDPNAGHFELAELYAHLGFDEWRREMELALELDPTNEFIKGTYAMFYIINAQPEEALAVQKRLYNAGPDALYYLTKKMGKEAAPLIEKSYRKQPDNQVARLFYALSLALQGKFQEAEALIPVILENARVNPGYHHFTHIITRIYALEGKREEAVRWLRMTAREGYPNYLAFQRDPYLEDIRNHPAFVQLMEELKTRWEHCRREIE
ncbi:MAG: protein kinase [Acidobacteria bacterium]|nr:protein kinase [Acidobacteriota bacterium]